MARDFTPEELEEIRKSSEFEKYVIQMNSDENTGEDLHTYRLDELLKRYVTQNGDKLEARFNARNNELQEVPDLSRLDETGLTGLTTSELVAMLRDPNYAGGDNEQFRQEVADLFEKYHNGKTANEAEFKAKMK